MNNQDRKGQSIWISIGILVILAAALIFATIALWFSGFKARKT